MFKLTPVTVGYAPGFLGEDYLTWNSRSSKYKLGFGGMLIELGLKEGQGKRWNHRFKHESNQNDHCKAIPRSMNFIFMALGSHYVFLNKEVSWLRFTVLDNFQVAASFKYSMMNSKKKLTRLWMMRIER